MGYWKPLSRCCANRRMPMKRVAFRIAAAALVAGVISAQQLPALAAARAAPGISIAAKSHITKISGDVLVIWRTTPDGSATIHGTLTRATTGQDLRLYAQQFP